MYYKGTKTECGNYDSLVTEGENYSGTTTKWGETNEVEGVWYIVKNKKYLSEMEEVEAMPIVKIEL